MTGIFLKAIFGVFVWLALPPMLWAKRNSKSTNGLLLLINKVAFAS